VSYSPLPFRIFSNTDLLNQNINKGGAAYENGEMQRGDILIAVDNNEVTGLSHSDVIHFMSNAARNGIVKLTLRRDGFPQPPNENISRANSNSTCKTLYKLE